MLTLKRFLNLKTIALVATLVFIVACYFATRKVMVGDVELGMSRADVLEVLGQRFMALGFASDESHTALIWEKTLFSEKAFQQHIVVWFDRHDKVTMIGNRVIVFGHIFGSSADMASILAFKKLFQNPVTIH